MRTRTIGATAVLALALAPAGVFAQDDMMGTVVPHPAHIHEGLCPEPGGVVAPLNDVTVAGNDSQGVAEQIHVDVSVSNVELPLEAILAADHSINVHQSADDMGTYIACGNIGGHLVEGSFVIGLGPVGASGFSGIAWLTDQGDGSTEVRVAITASGATAMDSMDAMDEINGMDDTDAMGDDMGEEEMDGEG